MATAQSLALQFAVQCGPASEFYTLWKRVEFLACPEIGRENIKKRHLKLFRKGQHGYAALSDNPYVAGSVESYFWELGFSRARYIDRSNPQPVTDLVRLKELYLA